MRVAILASGGKDSSYASWWALLQGWEVVSLVTVGVTGEDSMMFQIPNTAVAGLQSASIGVPWLPVISNGSEESEVTDLERAISGLACTDKAFEEMWPEYFITPEHLMLHSGELDIDGLVVGALRSDYQKTRIELMCERIGIHSFCPLWHKEESCHMSSLLSHGFKVVFTSVSCEGMDRRWLGLELDEESLESLRVLANEYRFNLDGEGGEFETIVTDAPHFSKAIAIEGKSTWRGSGGVWIASSCSLVS